MDDREQSWRELEKDFDLYKFYIELLLKVALFVFGITGAMVSFYFLHTSEPLMVYSLVLPLIMNCGFCILCFFSAPLAKRRNKDHFTLCEKLDYTLPHDMNTLPFLIELFAVMYLLSTIGLTVLLVRGIF